MLHEDRTAETQKKDDAADLQQHPADAPEAPKTGQTEKKDDTADLQQHAADAPEAPKTPETQKKDEANHAEKDCYIMTGYGHVVRCCTSPLSLLAREPRSASIWSQAEWDAWNRWEWQESWGHHEWVRGAYSAGSWKQPGQDLPQEQALPHQQRTGRSKANRMHSRQQRNTSRMHSRQGRNTNKASRVHSRQQKNTSKQAACTAARRGTPAKQAACAAARTGTEAKQAACTAARSKASRMHSCQQEQKQSKRMHSRQERNRSKASRKHHRHRSQKRRRTKEESVCMRGT